MNKFYMIPSDKQLDKYTEELILPLENYSIGFDTYFSLEEINDISKNRIVNVIINRFMHKKDIYDLKDIINNLKFNVKLFFIEDLGLTSIIPSDRVVLYQSHLINNYLSINAFKELGIENIVINNDLTINEIKTIKDKTDSNIFIVSSGVNTLMYSRRHLLTSYFDYKNIDNHKMDYTIVESASKKPLMIKEEDNGTIILNDRIFSLNKYFSVLDAFNFIVNFNNLNEENKNILLNHYKDLDLSNYLNVDDYFLDNEIIYKVGEK